MTYEPARLDSEEWMFAVQVRRRLEDSQSILLCMPKAVAAAHEFSPEGKQTYLTQTKMLIAMKIPR